MFVNRFQQLVASKNIIRRYKWTCSKVSSCGTYHICLTTQLPLYENRFKTVLPFHSPGLAPVVDQVGAAFHINDQGENAYLQRFSRTFGFYQNLAAVKNVDQWYHITPEGSSAYKSVWQWCGNFQSYRCPVRDFDLKYYHIDPTGRIRSGPHSYAGDFREGSAVVRSSIDGLFRAIDENGDSLHSSSNKTSFFDLDVYHKGLARARDENGWFFIDCNGVDSGQGRRYRQIENFYNGQALVQLLHDGTRCIIDEQHQILARLHNCNDENNADIEQMAKAYWISFALKMGLEQKINLVNDESTSDHNHFREQIRRVWSELGFIKPLTTDGKYNITERGRLLFDSNSIARARALYWLQDRYISAWLPNPNHQNKPHSDTDIFSEIANDPELVALSQKVLHSYASQDWRGIASVLPMELLQSSTIVDLGGGIGALLSELANYSSSQHLICIDRPEVIRLAAYHSKIEFKSGDLFSGSLPSADCYFLSRVLHDWPDEKVKTILNRIPSNYLCIIDREVDLNINQHALLSLHMFLLQGARERTREEWDNLFSTTAWSVLSRTPFSDHTVTLLKKDKIKNTPEPVALFPSRKSTLRKVVIPTAGLGIRMRPQSTILPKVLLPITEPTSTIWTCRPVLDLLLEEIFEKGTEIEQVLLVVSPEQLHLFQSYLSSYPHQKIEYILQESPKGFGHAVLQTEQFIDNEPFLVMLSDHLHQSNNSNESCLQQLLNAYRQNVTEPSNISLTGVMTCTSEEVCSTGLLQSHINMRNKQFFEITDMMEKPSIELAINRFQSRTFNNHFLCQAGIDILPPTIFHQLREHEQKLEQEKISSELGLREAMNSLRQNGQLYGCLLDGHRYDIGTPKEYYRTFRAFAVEKKQRSPQNSPVFDGRLLVQHIDKVRALFSVSKAPIYSASAPGRLDVMGGFADYSGSHVLQYPIAQRTHAFIQSSDTDTVRMISIQTDSIQFSSINPNKLIVWEREIPMNVLLDDSQPLRKRLEAWYNQQQNTSQSQDEPVNWPSYILGILVELINKIDKASIPSGFNVVIISDVPCNKGVASSAALEVTVARAASTCLNLDHVISNTELALLCQHVENHVVGSSCGFMDQMTCVHACSDHLFSLLCQHSPNPPFRNVTLPSNIQLVGIDSGVKRSTASSAYRRVRTAAFMGKQLINLPNDIHHLCQITLSKFNTQFRMLLPNKMLGRDFRSTSHLDSLTTIDSNEIYPVRAATAHPIEENFRVQLFEQLLKNDHHLSMDHLSNLGELMYQSDAGYRSCELDSEETNLLVSLIRQHKSSSNVLFGAKITGGGGGGTVAVLAQNSPKATEAIQNIITQYEFLTQRRTRIFSGSSSGLVAYPSMILDT